MLFRSDHVYSFNTDGVEAAVSALAEAEGTLGVPDDQRGDIYHMLFDAVEDTVSDLLSALRVVHAARS